MDTLASGPKGTKIKEGLLEGWGPGDPRWQGLPMVSCSSERVGAQHPWTTLKLTESALLGAPYGSEMPLGCAQRGNS